MSGEWLKPNDFLVFRYDHFYDDTRIEVLSRETCFDFYGAMSEFLPRDIRCVVISVEENRDFYAYWSHSDSMYHRGQLRISQDAIVNASLYRDQSNYDLESKVKEKKNLLYYTRRPFMLLWSAPQVCNFVPISLDPLDLLRRPIEEHSIDFACIFSGELSVNAPINPEPDDPTLKYSCKLVQARMKLQTFINKRKPHESTGKEYRRWSTENELNGALFRLFIERLTVLEVFPNMYDETLADVVLIELRKIFAIYRTDQEVIEELTSIYESLFDRHFSAQSSVLGHLSNLFNHNRDANRQVIYALSFLDFITAMDQFCKNKPIDPTTLQYEYPAFVEELKRYQRIVLNAEVSLEDPVLFSYHSQSKLSLLQDMHTFNRKYASLVGGIIWLRARFSDEGIATRHNFTMEERLTMI